MHEFKGCRLKNIFARTRMIIKNRWLNRTLTDLSRGGTSGSSISVFCTSDLFIKYATVFRIAQ